MSLEMLIQKIKPLNQVAMTEAQRHLDDLTKPPGSLGVLETIGKHLAGIYGAIPSATPKKTIVLMAGDHGVVAEGVSAFPSEVTLQMVANFANGGAGINVLARHAGVELVCVDVGIAGNPPDLPNLRRCKVAYGTKNMARGPAMTQEQAVRAILTGADLVGELAAAGTGIVGTGEMGIGNTTSSAALIAVFSGMPPADVVGRGTGLNDRQLERKIRVVEQAIAVNRPRREDPLDALAKLGGLEIAGLTGVILGAAANRMPVVIDGFISGAAAVVAGEICPLAKEYMLGSHLSEEPGHKIMLEYLGLEPILMMRFRLGEGTGAALGMFVVDAAVKIMNEMATFSQAGVAGKVSGSDG
ncbi:MAG: nicotinate-nucleotide--dimethylbenzimidazole phosphoribosyltransferase [Heliobacteriaceae bacterium]|nr:nicotinate-nucleotide--dimethylbenzimidazole phosphoribosyltransferase [Heliobacteriaceae bacterium]